ncbi:hypothetical protein SAMN02745220_05023 [Desulfopila aestuarii DSM 18488]|uniref:Uncharacterized protein n=1 Tax=Desulfopila aestuarii DSM 18488 TaxID=1121416 RepID=A0A1M7YKV8_9BACT|nr:hypothetical protein SAMN02745220_05023 [Desulfopila aestuarii DSM 18488]
MTCFRLTRLLKNNFTEEYRLYSENSQIQKNDSKTRMVISITNLLVFFNILLEAIKISIS